MGGHRYFVGGGELGHDNFFLVIDVFNREPYNTPLRNKWTQGIQLFLEGVRTIISKETYSH